jgi:hypothetical protein
MASSLDLRSCKHSSAAAIGAALCLAFTLGACKGPTLEVGRAPEGVRRPRTEDIMSERTRRLEKQRREGEVVADAEERVARERRMEFEGGNVVVGLYGTGLYHKTDCEIARASRRTDRITFVSIYDGLDAGYRACGECDPGP